jgi:hypothetical protein
MGDAGLAISTPYPLVLPPAWKVQLILSFDFSTGDPFEVTKKGLGRGLDWVEVEVELYGKELKALLGGGQW